MAALRALPSRVLFVADAAHAAGGLPALVRRGAEAGLRFIEVRRARRQGEAAMPSAPFLDEIRACLLAAPGAVLLVNDRVDLAVLAGAHGAHVGQDDLPPAAARRLLGAGRWLGFSTHDAAQLAAAQDEPLDYVALGPIFESTTKSGHAAPVGLDGLAARARLSRLPVVAIGGITPANAAAVLEAGASAVAVAAAIAEGDLASNAAALLRAVGE